MSDDISRFICNNYGIWGHYDERYRDTRLFCNFVYKGIPKIINNNYCLFWWRRHTASFSRVNSNGLLKFPCVNCGVVCMLMNEWHGKSYRWFSNIVSDVIPMFICARCVGGERRCDALCRYSNFVFSTVVARGFPSSCSLTKESLAGVALLLLYLISLMSSYEKLCKRASALKGWPHLRQEFLKFLIKFSPLKKSCQTHRLYFI